LKEVSAPHFIGVVAIAQPDVRRSFNLTAAGASFGIAFLSFKHEGIDGAVSGYVFSDKTMLVDVQGLHQSCTGIPVDVVDEFIAKP
jgi:hypothetical protein